MIWLIYLVDFFCARLAWFASTRSQQRTAIRLSQAPCAHLQPLNGLLRCWTVGTSLLQALISLTIRMMSLVVVSLSCTRRRSKPVFACCVLVPILVVITGFHNLFVCLSVHVLCPVVPISSLAVLGYLPGGILAECTRMMHPLACTRSTSTTVTRRPTTCIHQRQTTGLSRTPLS